MLRDGDRVAVGAARTDLGGSDGARCEVCAPDLDLVGVVDEHGDALHAAALLELVLEHHRALSALHGQQTTADEASVLPALLRELRDVNRHADVLLELANLLRILLLRRKRMLVLCDEAAEEIITQAGGDHRVASALRDGLLARRTPRHHERRCAREREHCAPVAKHRRPTACAARTTALLERRVERGVTLRVRFRGEVATALANRLPCALARHRGEHACTNIVRCRGLHGLLEGTTQRAVEGQALATELTRSDVVLHLERTHGIELAIEVRSEQEAHLFAWLLRFDQVARHSQAAPLFFARNAARSAGLSSRVLISRASDIGSPFTIPSARAWL